jgi:signal transduction histidine kinase
LATLLTVAEVALDTAKDHAARQRETARGMLVLQLVLLIAALAMAAGMMLMVSFRVTSPLRLIQQAMLKLAAGDLTAQVSFGARNDEIGALGRAMLTFKESMVEADRLRGEQKEAEARAAIERRTAAEREEAQKRDAAERERAVRTQAMRKLADDFEAAVGRIIGTVSVASSQLEASAGTLTTTADATLQLTGAVVAASEEASANVATVATAAEEMTGSVNEIARQVQERYARQAAERQINLLFTPYPDLPPASGDTRSLERALMALVDNAIKFSPVASTVQIRTRLEGEKIQVTVEDHGIGIPSETRPHIFDRFYHLDRSGDELFNGIGLGLAITRQVIEQHHGSLDVDSETGKGSTFTITLKKWN